MHTESAVHAERDQSAYRSFHISFVQGKSSVRADDAVHADENLSARAACVQTVPCSERGRESGVRADGFQVTMYCANFNLGKQSAFRTLIQRTYFHIE